ncbi:acyltransferase family protein [Demequina globuliformis]|uniref:acyltransferase family protein n=1 Tax=Demequina globuliformis TaxID=676202 RepID=UPI000783549E|nr:acyltransferase [Demequina globuliformis]
MPRDRNAKIEALRIAAMLGIVAHHYAIHGGVIGGTESGNTAVFLAVFSSFGKWGVDVFVLVSAWFMVDRPARGKALSRVYSETLPVSWLIGTLMAVTGVVALSSRDVAKAVAPVVFSEYWFVTAFVLLVLISPYLTIVIDALTKQQLGRLLAGGLVLWSVLTLVPGIALGMSDLAWFAFLYLIAGYLKRHGLPWTPRVLAVTALVSVGVLVLGVALAASWRVAIGSPADVWWVMTELASQSSLLTAVPAIAVVAWATTSRPWRSPLIVTVASASFGVYLIHDNPLIRRVLWSDVVDTTGAAGQAWLPLHAVGWSLAIYVACTALVLALQPVCIRPMHRVTERLRAAVTNTWGSGEASTKAPDRR